MRIQLERKRYPCRDHLRCTVCQHSFAVGQVRSLLYQDGGLLQGDVCPTCVQLTAKDFQQTIVLNARILLQQSNLHDAQTMTLHEEALELLETAKEPVKFPTVWQRLVMRLSLSPQDTQ